MKAGEALVTLRVNISVSVNGTFDIFNVVCKLTLKVCIEPILNGTKKMTLTVCVNKTLLNFASNLVLS